MPFTPFHMGPGLAIKAVAGRHFSLIVFGFAQVAIDIEPLVRILRGDSVLHGFTHTYLGATLIAVAVIFAGRPVCQSLLDWWNAGLSSKWLARFRSPAPISWRATVTGAFIGTYSHVFLDGIMHVDLQPYAPFSTANNMLGFVSIDALHLFCAGAGAAGVVGMLGLVLWRGRRQPCRGASSRK